MSELLDDVVDELVEGWRGAQRNEIVVGQRVCNVGVAGVERRLERGVRRLEIGEQRVRARQIVPAPRRVGFPVGHRRQQRGGCGVLVRLKVLHGATLREAPEALEINVEVGQRRRVRAHAQHAGARQHLGQIVGRDLAAAKVVLLEQTHDGARQRRVCWRRDARLCA
jgi:hypothetical protein